MFFPIHAVIVKGHIEVVKLLIKAGASIEAPCYNLPGESTAQDYGVASSHGEGIHVMVTPLYLAIVRQRCDIAELLLKAGASTNLCSAGERLSPLHVAVGAGAGTRMIQFCVDQGLCDSAQLHEANYSGLPPIWLAVLNQKWAALPLLQKLGADINHDLAEGFTPLTYLLLLDDLHGVSRLIEAKAKTDIAFVRALDNYGLRGRPNPEHLRAVIRGNRSLEKLAACRGLRPLELCLRYFTRSALACAVHDDHPDHASEMFPSRQLRQFMMFVDIQGLSVDVNAKGEAGTSTAASLFEARTSKYTGHQKQNPFYLRVQCSWTRCRNLDDIINVYGGDRMATDAHGNTLVELALGENDFKACGILMAGCPEAIAKFSEYWTLDSFMDTFVGDLPHWEEMRKFAEDESSKARDWAFIIHEGLRVFINNGISTTEEIANHPLFCRLVCRAALQHVSRRNLIPLLKRVKPQPEVLTESWYNKTPLQHAVTTRDVKLVELLLDLGVNPDELNPMTGEWLAEDLTSCCDQARCKTKAIVDSLVEQYSEMIDPDDLTFDTPAFDENVRDARDREAGYALPPTRLVTDRGLGGCGCKIPWHQISTQYWRIPPWEKDMQTYEANSW